MSKAIDFTVQAILGQIACPACHQPTSVAVVNGQRLSAKRLVKFNAQRLDKMGKR